MHSGLTQRRTLNPHWLNVKSSPQRKGTFRGWGPVLSHKANHPLSGALWINLLLALVKEVPRKERNPHHYAAPFGLIKIRVVSPLGTDPKYSRKRNQPLNSALD